MRTVAEGRETNEQAAFLGRWGAMNIKASVFAPPDEFAAFAKSANQVWQVVRRSRTK